jgi:hypothetical protein
MIAELKQLGRQTRRHSPEQIDHLVSLLKAYGFVTPILVDQENRVIDGWAVVMAAKKLGLSKIPVVCNRDLSDVELRALKIALNKIPELSSWEHAELKREIQEIFEIQQDLPLGIDVPTLDIILDGTGSRKRMTVRYWRSRLSLIAESVSNILAASTSSAAMTPRMFPVTRSFSGRTALA